MAVSGDPASDDAPSGGSTVTATHACSVRTCADAAPAPARAKAKAKAAKGRMT
ncbi:MAG: hypothetical protein HY905_26120 [Deltaproteobacteria bacterium]|nr:hypothetical protein [Deltaproteobacteria bacterium]